MLHGLVTGKLMSRTGVHLVTVFSVMLTNLPNIQYLSIHTLPKKSVYPIS
jgi:hypothetical protein